MEPMDIVAKTKEDASLPKGTSSSSFLFIIILLNWVAKYRSLLEFFVFCFISNNDQNY